MDKTEPNDKDVDRILREAFHSQSESSPRDENQPELVRTSRLAVVACVLAVMGMLLLPGLFRVSARGVPVSLRTTYQLVLYAVSLAAAVLGVASLIRIAASAGRLTGKGFACIGAVAPIVQGLLFIVLTLLARPTDVFIGPSCSSNLASIGKAMQIYANDYEDELPRAGGRGSKWTGRIPDWTAKSRFAAYGLAADGSGGHVSISASLYLLVKYEELKPERLMCRSRSTSVYRGYGWTARTKEDIDKGVSEFKPEEYSVPNGTDLFDLWDFGPKPSRHVSYAYHMVYGSRAGGLTVSSPPGFAVAADHNPWMDSPSAKAGDFSGYQPDIAPYNGTSEQAKRANSFRHQKEGQNVLFLDTHVEFEKRPYCGLDDDNIYTSWDGQDKARGVPPKLGSVPAGAGDSLLVNDPVSPSK